jgi:hypothetical protein
MMSDGRNRQIRELEDIFTKGSRRCFSFLAEQKAYTYMAKKAKGLLEKKLETLETSENH